MGKKILEAVRLYKNYEIGGRAIPILNDIDLSVYTGDFVALMGPSGSGKSSLLYLLGGLDTPNEGNVYIDGVDIHSLSDERKSVLRRRDIGFVFQFYNLVQNLTVEENILVPLIMDGKRTKDFEQELRELLDIVGLTPYRKYTPRQLSGGQQQRVAIAWAVITEPKIILADEPTGNLDSSTGTEIMELFKSINEARGMTIVHVTHSESAAAYSNRVIHLKDGKIVS